MLHRAVKIDCQETQGAGTGNGTVKTLDRRNDRHVANCVYAGGTVIRVPSLSQIFLTNPTDASGVYTSNLEKTSSPVQIHGKNYKPSNQSRWSSTWHSRVVHRKIGQLAAHAALLEVMGIQARGRQGIKASRHPGDYP